MLVRSHRHPHGVTLVASVVFTAERMERDVTVGDAGLAEIPFQPVLKQDLELESEKVGHEGLRRVHIRKRNAGTGIRDGDFRFLPFVELDGRRRRRLPHIVRPMVFLHQHAGHQHGKNVHLLPEFRRVDVTAHDDGLLGLGLRHQRKGVQHGGIQHIGTVKRHPAEAVNGGAVHIREETVRARSDFHPAQEGRLQPFPLGGGEGFVPLDDGNIGIPLLGGVRDHIKRNAAAQRPFLDARIDRK